MAEDTAPPESPALDLSDRVDALLSSALADQAREKKQLVDTLYGARAALVKAEEEIEGLKTQISKRDQELLEAIDKKFATRIEAIEEAILQLAKSVAQVPVKVRKDIEVAAVAVGERIGEEADSLLSSFREDAVEVVGTTSKLFDKNLATTQNAIEAAREEYRTTTEQVVRYLGERDDALQRQRDQVLISLFKQLGESLGRRNAKKLSKAIAEPEVGRSTPPAPKAKKTVPAPYRRPPSYPQGAPTQLAPGTSVVSPPDRAQPLPLGPLPAPAPRPVDMPPPPPAAAPSPATAQTAFHPMPDQSPPPPAGEAAPPPAAAAPPVELEEEVYDVVPVGYDEVPYGDEPFEEEAEPERPAARPQGRPPRGPDRDYLVRVPTFPTPEEEMQDRLAGAFAHYEPEPESGSRRARRKSSPPPQGPSKPKAPRGSRVVKAPKSQAPPRRGSRRRTED